MLDILQSALGVAQAGQALDHSTLHAWHAALFPTGRSGLTAIAVGQYRSHAEPMQIVTPSMAGSVLGNEVVHFEAPPSAEVAAHMGALLAWFGQSAGPAWPTCGLVRAALVHLWFEAIHPFEDGNGRIGRALAELALFQDWQATFSGAQPKRWFSLSQQLWLDRKNYYAQLQAATGAGALDVTPWVAWFVQCISLALQAAIAQIQSAVAKNQFWQSTTRALPSLSASQRKVLAKLYDTPDGFKNGLSTELYTTIAACSRATAYRDLTQLLGAGLLTQSGVGRGTRYRLVR
jgi:Fic family protein